MPRVAGESGSRPRDLSNALGMSDVARRKADAGSHHATPASLVQALRWRSMRARGVPMKKRILGRSGKGKAERRLEIQSHGGGEWTLSLGPPSGRSAETVVLDGERLVAALVNGAENAVTMDVQTAAKRIPRRLTVEPLEGDEVCLRVGRHGGDGGYDFVTGRREIEGLRSLLASSASERASIIPRCETSFSSAAETTTVEPADAETRDIGALLAAKPAVATEEPPPLRPVLSQDEAPQDAPAADSAQPEPVPADEASTELVSPSARERFAQSMQELMAQGDASEPDLLPAAHEYKVVPAPRRFPAADAGEIAQEAASYLEVLVNDMARLGWELYRIEQVVVEVPSGRLARLTGETWHEQSRSLVLFRRPIRP